MTSPTDSPGWFGLFALRWASRAPAHEAHHPPHHQHPTGDTEHSTVAIRTVLLDARHHRSPNAGWPEAAVAGALGIQLAGPRVYGGVATTDAVINAAGRADLGPADIRRALALYRRADALLIALLSLGGMLQWAL